MKRILLLAGTVLFSMGVNAQVGINTGEDPKGTLDVHYDTEWAQMGKVQGITPPKMTTTQRNAMQGIHEGLMIYNTTVHCLQVFDGTAWSCSDGSHEEIPPIVGRATATLGLIDPLRWVALEYNGTYYSSPKDGIANNASIPVKVPYNNATSGSYTAYEQTFTLPDKNGTPRNFKLSYPAGTINSTSGTITAALTNVSGVTYTPKAQPIDGQYKDLATPQITFNGASAQTLKVQAIGGIPDRCYGKTTQECVGYGANVREHDFVYMPVRFTKGGYDEVWLNNNLGADYANVNSSVFDPTKQATDPTDYHAYGSLFQWQRNPDGHELMDWSSSTSGDPKHKGVGSLSNSWENAGTNKFIANNSADWSWVNNSVNNAGPFNLWESGGSTNPCPVGYHVPTHGEQVALHNAIVGSNVGTSWSNTNKVWNDAVLRLSATGFRFGEDASFRAQSSTGYIWTSSKGSAIYSWHLYFHHSNSTAGGDYIRANGLGVRCLKD